MSRSTSLGLGAALVLLWTGLARAAEPVVTPPIVVEMTLNGVPQGDVFPRLRDQDVLVPAATLEAAGVDLVRLGARVEVIDGQRYVSLAGLGPLASFQLDERTAKLQCELPATAFVTTRVDMGPTAPEGYTLTGSPSAFLNYAAHARNSGFTLYGETGASLGRALFTTQARWTPGGNPLWGLSQLTVDFPEVMLRAIAGEATGHGGVLGGGAVVAGVHVQRSFELNPYFVRNPVQDLAGDVSTPSVLEVYVNNRLVRRAELPPGPYRLENFTVPRGEGVARYVVRDAFGRTREVSSSYSLGAQLLAPGVADYQLSLGVERRSLATRSFDYGRPLLLGHFRMGATRWLTPGVRLELSPDLLSTGAAQWLQLPKGELELSEALSISERRRGLAAGLAYSLQGRWAGGQLFTRVQSPDYANASLVAGRTPPLEAGGSVFVALGSRVSFGGQAVAMRWKSGEWTTRLGASTSAQLLTRAMLSFSASRNQELQGPSSLEGMVHLTAVLDPRTTVNVGHTQGRRRGATALDISRGIPLEGGLGFQAQAQLGSQDMALARVDYDTQVGRVSGNAEWHGGALVGGAEVSGAVVALGGGLHVTRAVDQGYALVRVKGASGIGVRLNNHFIGRTNADGELVVTRLQAYGVNRLSLVHEDLPLDLYVTATEKLVAPWRKGGALLDFEVDSVRAYRGKLVLEKRPDAFALVQGTLQVEVDGQRWESGIGWHGEFELVGIPPGRHEAHVNYPGGRCAAVLEIPSLPGPVIDLGSVGCADEAKQ
ncbi:fimbria/pilus outer membrane usher protein [Myxococcus sp. K38C18041901]|uniref:fimbria/pilus outer membrane usher protein n=1 Tax=Myxococcus guangdongensis TaxID=2906760 RepID=UPI0020A72AB0|nr:fimbria/pilus outer membrane usher protein [Myxococcus guangdongensis]MCP3065097.1 fimbria/pilus outer membrane usher protein [Myxococcus guangdongensis]